MQKLSVIATNACGWPNLVKLPSGRILCTYFNAPSHGLPEGDLVCSISDRKGNGWKKLSTVAGRPKGGNRMHLAVGIAGNGELLCFSGGFFVEDGEFKGFSDIGFHARVTWEKIGPLIRIQSFPKGTVEPFLSGGSSA